MKTICTVYLTCAAIAVLLYCGPLHGQGDSMLSIGNKFVVVIDPGHGGHDVGTSGSHSHEKDVVLDIAVQTGEWLMDMLPQAHVVYTRDRDVFIPLEKRIELANQLQADLFVSIHCNASEHAPRATGTETFVMGLHSSDENLAVAKRENASILLEADYRERYADFDPFTIEGHILLSAIQNNHLGRSIEVAEKIQKHVSQKTGLMDRGVRQAGFVLLRQATMPAILVETAFLSNPHDESFLNSDLGKKEISRSIAAGLADYGRYILDHKSNIPDEAIAVRPVLPVRDIIPPIEDLKTHQVVSIEETAIQPMALTTIEETATENTQEADIFEVVMMPTAQQEIVYKVQVASAKNPIVDENFNAFHVLGDIEVKKEGSLFKYVTGQYSDLQKAVDEQSRIRSLGFNGAFVVAYDGNRRVKLSEIGS